MIGGLLRELAGTPLMALFALAGCDALTAHPFAGTVMQYTLAGTGETPPGKHLEVWATTQYGDIVRIGAYVDLANGETAYGLMIRNAISADPIANPCMINFDNGYLLTDPRAYPSTITSGGVPQTPEQQAKQVTDRIKQLSMDSSGQALMAVVPYDPTPVPSIDADASAEERLSACRAYMAAGDNTYIPNPAQVSAPAHGMVYGFLAFNSTTPPASYNGFRLDSPLNLQGIREIFFTTEDELVDPVNRGPLFLVSQPSLGGRDVIRFELIHAAPGSTAAGAVSVYADLDSDTVPF